MSGYYKKKCREGGRIGVPSYDFVSEKSQMKKEELYSEERK
jgi:hypothetical protein